MKKNRQFYRVVLAISLTTLLSGIAAAGNNVVTARQVTNVQKKQAQSIEQGVKVGKLTPKEAKKLNNEQAEIDELKEKLRANGSLDTDELALLFKRLETARNNINKLLRNNISSYGQLERISLKTASAAIH